MKRIALTALAITATLSGLLVVVASTLPRATEPAAAAIVDVPPQPSTFEIRLESQYGPTAPTDPHAPFSGGCWANGTYATVSGTTPKAYTITAPSISCSFQKANGTIWPLKATVLRDGVPVQHVTTETEYGVVSFVI